MLNKGLEVGNFPCTMKLANVAPVYKKGNRGILPNIKMCLQIFERCVYKQMSQYFEGTIAKYKCDVWKGLSA